MERKSQRILCSAFMTLFAITALLFTPAWSAEPAKGKVIELKGVTMLPPFIPMTKDFRILVDAVNEQAKGELKINYLGGPEVIPNIEQAQAVKRGVVDIAWISPSYFPELVPHGDMGLLTQLWPSEERESGAHEFLLDLYRKHGFFYLGHGLDYADTNVFYLFTTKPIRKLADLRDKRIQMENLLRDCLPALFNTVSVPIKKDELYTALQRGMLDGFLNPIDYPHAAGLHQVVKNALDEPLFKSTSIILLVNLNIWNKIPQNLQNLVINVHRRLERTSVAMNSDRFAVERQKLKDSGLEFTRFSAEESKLWYQKIYNFEWERMIKKYPDIAPKLRPLISR